MSAPHRMIHTSSHVSYDDSFIHSFIQHSYRVTHTTYRQRSGSAVCLCGRAHARAHPPPHTPMRATVVRSTTHVNAQSQHSRFTPTYRKPSVCTTPRASWMRAPTGPSWSRSPPARQWRVAAAGRRGWTPRPRSWATRSPSSRARASEWSTTAPRGAYSSHTRARREGYVKTKTETPTTLSVRIGDRKRTLRAGCPCAHAKHTRRHNTERKAAPAAALPRTAELSSTSQLRRFPGARRVSSSSAHMLWSPTL